MGSPTFLTRFFVCNMGPSDIISGRSSDIILGGPWHYNNYVIYHGCASIISVKTGAVHQLLKSLLGMPNVEAHLLVCLNVQGRISFWKGMTQQSFRTS